MQQDLEGEVSGLLDSPASASGGLAPLLDRVSD
jgi:hypothetical protein